MYTCLFQETGSRALDLVETSLAMYGFSTTGGRKKCVLMDGVKFCILIYSFYLNDILRCASYEASFQTVLKLAVFSPLPC